MAIFGKDHTNDLAYLNEERVKLWQRITELEKLIAERPFDLEKEAKQASRETSKYRNRAQERSEEAEVLVGTIRTIKDDLQATQTLIEANKAALESQMSVVETSVSTLENLEVATNKKVTTIEAKIAKVEEVFAEHPDLEAEIDTLDATIAKANESSSRVTAISKNTASRKAEIDELYYEIAGTETTDEETGQVTRTEGLRDNLENQYDKLEEDLKRKTKELGEIRDQAQQDFDDFNERKDIEAGEYLDAWDTKYTEIEATISGLLPRALTAGLSGAFYDKKKAEQDAFDSLRAQFLWGVGGLVIVSLIPFGLSVNFLMNDVGWDVVIARMPRLVLAILPLYLPVLWVAFAANKKMNLSKRLIEEYSHKEVLSRTFHGLSTQIEKTKGEGISEELRTRLLVNFLTASAENPGKLISNYETSDHPVMDFMEHYGFAKDKHKVAKKLESKKSEVRKVAEGVKKVADTAVDLAENNFPKVD